MSVRFGVLLLELLSVASSASAYLWRDILVAIYVNVPVDDLLVEADKSVISASFLK